MKTPEQWLEEMLPEGSREYYLLLIRDIQKDAAELNTTRFCVVACPACKELMDVVLEKDGRVLTTSLGVKDKPEYHHIPPNTKTI